MKAIGISPNYGIWELKKINSIKYSETDCITCYFIKKGESKVHV